ncbi:MAG: gamma-glutamylcyclotransferase [Bdellovibrionales bacterium]|nr:gamma-glutamylcyclotransferase [Bdellovibrionales bacterium]NQZ19156.1 gamma-glutamylcyclotransferase [Bdellovibrionales bacterium]
MIKFFFLYGTLQPGKKNHSVLKDISGSWTKATVIGTLLDRGRGAKDGFWGLSLESDGSEVPGYLFQPDELEPVIKLLDKFEGSGYQRVTTMATLETGESVEAYVYNILND